MTPRRVQVRLAAAGIGSALVLGMATHTTAAAPDSLRSSGAPLIYQKSRSFRVPFHFDPAERDRRREIQLWVSEDSGRTWTHKGTTTPDKPALSFRAEHDGEYWLAVRTLDAQGKLNPSDSERVVPSMKVVVDTAPPTVQLQPQVRSASLASVRWEVRDASQEVGALTLEYQVAGTEEWRPVPESRSGLDGIATWDTGFSRPLKVRASVVDRAGNKAQTVIDVPGNRPDLAALAATDARAPSAPPPDSPLPPRDGATEPAKAEVDSSERLPELPPPETEPEVETRPVGASVASDPVGPPPKETAPQAPPPANPPSGEASLPPSMVARPAEAPLADSLAKPPGSAAPESPRPRPDPGAVPGPPSGETGPAADPGKPASPPVNQPGSDPNVGTTSLTTLTTDPGSPAKAVSTEIPRLKVPGPRFTLDYAVDDAGTGGPAIVELWVTRDGGRTWKKQGKDADRVSPIDVELSKEGTYGLSLIARDAKGLGDRPPESGDWPQMWVEVAAQPPRAGGLLQRAFRR